MVWRETTKIEQEIEFLNKWRSGNFLSQNSVTILKYTVLQCTNILRDSQKKVLKEFKKNLEHIPYIQ